MENKVLCPYCGAEMQLACDLGVFFECPKCESTSPYVGTHDDAISAALQRYTEPNRVLPFDEVIRLNSDAPVYIEQIRGGVHRSFKGDVARGLTKENMYQAQCRYNKSVRIWLRRPTDEERQSVAWEESK